MIRNYIGSYTFNSPNSISSNALSEEHVNSGKSEIEFAEIKFGKIGIRGK